MSLICVVCFWEDDAFVGDRTDEQSMCTHMTLRQGRANSATFGACERIVDSLGPFLARGCLRRVVAA